MITVKDIAKLAGVSRGTVDRVLNNRGQVSKERRELILRIAKENGYVKNIMASKLAKAKEYLLVSIIPDPSHTDYWKLWKSGVDESLRFAHNFGIRMEYHFFDVQSKSSFEAALQKCVKLKPNGIILAPYFGSESLAFLQVAQQNNLQVVCVEKNIYHENVLSYIGPKSNELAKVVLKLANLALPSIKKVIHVYEEKHSFQSVKLSLLKKDMDQYQIKKVGYALEHIVIYRKGQQNKTSLKKILDASNTTESLLLIDGAILRDDANLNEQLDRSFFTICQTMTEGSVEKLKEEKIDFIVDLNPKLTGDKTVEAFFYHLIYGKEWKRDDRLTHRIIMAENL